MASRSHSWFDDAKLLPTEHVVRSGAARLRMATPPYWWEGELILTSDRLFLLPYADHPRLGNTAFWLADVGSVEASGRNRFTVRGAGTALFQVIGSRRGPAGLIGNHATGWLAAIEAERHTARPSAVFDRISRRAAG